MKITYKDFKRLEGYFADDLKNFKAKEWAKIEKDFAETTKDLIKFLEEEFDSEPVISKVSIYDSIALSEGQEGRLKKLQEAYNATKEKMQSSKYAKYYLFELKIEDNFSINKKRIEVSFFIRGFDSDLSRRFSEMNIAINFIHHK